MGSVLRFDVFIATHLSPRHVPSELDVIFLVMSKSSSRMNIEAELASLSKAEKAAVMQRLALDVAEAWPGIERTPEVAGGEARIVRTRIPVWTLVNYLRLGWTEGRILENFPELRAVDLVQAWSYADSHREEIEKAIARNEAA